MGDTGLVPVLPDDPHCPGLPDDLCGPALRRGNRRTRRLAKRAGAGGPKRRKRIDTSVLVLPVDAEGVAADETERRGRVRIGPEDGEERARARHQETPSAAARRVPPGLAAARASRWPAKR